MRKISFAVLSMLAATIPAHAQDADATGAKASTPAMLGIVRPRGWKPSGDASPAVSGNMVYHGGKILPTVTSKAIWWGTSWPTYAGDKITGIDSWYLGHNGSDYAATVDEYTGTNGQVGSTGLVHQGHVIDPTRSKSGGNTSAILAEVCKAITAGKIVPDLNGNGYYPVYTDKLRGNNGYCAWHSAGSCKYNGKNVPLQFAYFFKLDGDAGCDPGDTSTSHSQGLAALAT
jgi:hypothetical protein